jgi:hypothetical protein
MRNIGKYADNVMNVMRENAHIYTQSDQSMNKFQCVNLLNLLILMDFREMALGSLVSIQIFLTVRIFRFI